MTKKIHFLSGLPRSGSTLLAAILNQHPQVHATSTSGLLDMMVGTLRAWHDSMATHATVDKEAAEAEIQRVLNAIPQTKYAHIDKPVILDKARGWASDVNMRTMARVLGHKPKIVATVRSVQDCAASFVRVARPDDLDHFVVHDELIGHLKESYQLLMGGYTFGPECFLFVEYDDLVKDPKTELARVHEFLELDDFEGYDFANIDGSGLRERDEEVWLIPGLHDVKPKLEFQHSTTAEETLKHRYLDFVQPRFWRGEQTADKPIHKLDMQLAVGLMGGFEEGLRLANELEQEEPWNNRAAFNRGWYRMYEGKLLEGEQLLFRGRLEKVFGNEPPRSPMPMWDGATPGTVLLNLEGGLGDQIHGLRYAREINRRGCKTIVACSGALAALFHNLPDVTAVCQHDAAYGVVHDFWLPSMSTIPVLGYEYADIDGTPYMPRPTNPDGKKLRVGLRWQGNPKFEHEQHRIFPPALLFDAVENIDAEFVSLQRDEGAQYKPYWVDKTPLDHWGQTAMAIASCDVVITSCTSVAHLAGAMGVPTWIIVPILPYYLWAPPGESTVWYDSVRLFRQKVFGEWQEPFTEIREKLTELVNIRSKGVEQCQQQKQVIGSVPKMVKSQTSGTPTRQRAKKAGTRR